MAKRNNFNPETYLLPTLMTQGLMNIEPYHEDLQNLSDSKKYQKLQISSIDELQIIALASQLPAVVVESYIQTLPQLFTLVFPEGVNGDLMRYADGGYGSAIQGIGGGIVDHASYHSFSLNLTIFRAFTIISVASGQYFIAQIRKELNLVNEKMDKILDFLYGEKRAELLAEVTFVRHVQDNFVSMARYNEQRIATVTSLQQSQKIAMKDVEFFMQELNRLERKVVKSKGDLSEISKDASRIYQNLNLSVQLFVLAKILELYFVNNSDPDYRGNIEKELTFYVDKVNSRLLSALSSLRQSVGQYKSVIPKSGIESTKKSLDTVFEQMLEPLKNGETLRMNATIRRVLSSRKKSLSFVISESGEVYQKVDYENDEY